MVSGVFFRHIICALKIAIFFFHSPYQWWKEPSNQHCNAATKPKKLTRPVLKGKMVSCCFFVECKRALLFVVFFFIECISNDDIFARRLRSLMLFLRLQTRAPVVTSWSDDWSERALFIFVCRSYVDPEDRLSWQGRPFFYVRWNHQDEFFIKRFDQDFPWGPSKVCSYRLV